MTRERPILFSAPMVRAILDGRKTQTRRVVKPTAKGCAVGAYTTDGRKGIDPDDLVNIDDDNDPVDARPFRCPYGVAGDRLWVRETWREVVEAIPHGRSHGPIAYRATDEGADGPWKSSLFMRRADSRLTLVVKSVRVERLDDIAEEDALAEGIVVDRITPDGRTIYSPTFCGGGFESAAVAYRVGFRALAKLAYTVNPWVWVVEFARETP